jgi:hypothetical protein
MACVDREEGLVMRCDAPVLGRSNSSRLAARFQIGIHHRRPGIIAAPGVRDDERSHKPVCLRYWSVAGHEAS